MSRIKFKVGDCVRYKSDGEVVPVIAILGPSRIRVQTRKYGVCTEDQDDLELIEPALTDHRNVLPTDQDTRNSMPMADGLLDYFPNALAAVSQLSKVANEQHNPGEPIHWARNKSTDHRNKIIKHLIDAGGIDTDRQRHSAKVAWRALALLEDELIAAGAVPGRNAKGSPKVLPNQHHNCIEDEV